MLARLAVPGRSRTYRLATGETFPVLDDSETPDFIGSGLRRTNCPVYDLLHRFPSEVAMPNETPSPEAPVSLRPSKTKLLQTGFGVLLSESTRSERDRLLVASLLAFGIVAAGVKVEEGISIVEGIKVSFPQAWALPLGLVLMTIYFLITS